MLSRCLLIFSGLWLGANGVSAHGQIKTQLKPPLSPVISIEEKKPASPPALLSASSGWKLMRSGLAAVGEKGRDVWIFAYGRKQPIPEGSIFDDLLDMTIIVAEPVLTAKSKSHWKVLRQVPLGMRRENTAQEFSLRWLKPAEKSGPVLVVPYYGMQQTELLAFPDGWSQPIAIRQRCQGGMNPIQGFEFSFDEVDELGVLAVTLNITNYGEGGSTPARKRLIRWNGNGWGKPGETS